MNPYSTDLSEEEKKLLKQYEESQNAGQFGNLVGSGLGLLAGGIATAATGGTAAPVIPLLMSGGGALGGLIGGGVGGAQSEAALKQLEELRKKREAPTVEKQARAEALQRLLGKYSAYGV